MTSGNPAQPPLQTPWIDPATGNVHYQWQLWLSNASDIAAQALADALAVQALVAQIETEVMALPFAGVLGSGRHGATTISANTTETEAIPIYQLTTLDVQNGFTWTANTGLNPGGFVIAVQGRATIAGTIDLNGRGGRGGTAVLSGNGVRGDSGFNFAGTGGGGGASNGADLGGAAGPTRVGELYSQFDASSVIQPSTTTPAWFSGGGLDLFDAPQVRDVRAFGNSAIAVFGGSGGSGAVGSAGSAFSSLAVAPRIFAMAWALQRRQIMGWGSGGGSGAATGAGASGAGGNGGGCFILLCNELDFTGTINANGGNGSNGVTTSGGGGGGGGGSVIIGVRSLIVANSGTINVNGGTGGTNGGGTGFAGGNGGAGYSNVFLMRL